MEIIRIQFDKITIKVLNDQQEYYQFITSEKMKKSVIKIKIAP